MTIGGLEVEEPGVPVGGEGKRALPNGRKEPVEFGVHITVMHKGFGTEGWD
jgi:hypothetical protein